MQVFIPTCWGWLTGMMRRIWPYLTWPTPCRKAESLISGGLRPPEQARVFPGGGEEQCQTASLNTLVGETVCPRRAIVKIAPTVKGASLFPCFLLKSNWKSPRNAPPPPDGGPRKLMKSSRPWGNRSRGSRRPIETPGADEETSPEPDQEGHAGKRLQTRGGQAGPRSRP